MDLREYFFLLIGRFKHINIDGNEWNELVERVMGRRYRKQWMTGGVESLGSQGGAENQNTGGGINLRGEERYLDYFKRRNTGKNPCGLYIMSFSRYKLSSGGYCFPQLLSYPEKLNNLLKVTKENLGCFELKL